MWDKPTHPYQFVVITDSAGIKTIVICPVSPTTRLAPTLSSHRISTDGTPHIAARNPSIKTKARSNSRRITPRSPQQSYGYSPDYEDNDTPSSSSRPTYTGYESSLRSSSNTRTHAPQGQQSIPDTSYPPSSSAASSSSRSSISPPSQRQLPPTAALDPPVHKSSVTNSEESTHPLDNSSTTSENHGADDQPPAPLIKPSTPPPPPPPPPPHPPSQPSTTSPQPTPTPTPAGPDLQLPSIPGITDNNNNNPGPEAQKPFDVANLLKIGGSSVLGGGLTLVAIFFLVKYFIRRKHGKQGGEGGDAEGKNGDLEAGLGGMGVGLGGIGIGQQQPHQRQIVDDGSGSQPAGI